MNANERQSEGIIRVHSRAFVVKYEDEHVYEQFRSSFPEFPDPIGVHQCPSVV
jgi:hypothetical protein